MADSPVIVVLPTHTHPPYNQQILGRLSPFSPDLDEFRGIPFGFIPGRWQHSHVREKLPVDEYKAWINGLVTKTHQYFQHNPNTMAGQNVHSFQT